MEVPAPRGEIYDRYGKLLVTNETAYDVCIYYTKIEKKELNQMNKRSSLPEDLNKKKDNLNFGKIRKFPTNATKFPTNTSK